MSEKIKVNSKDDGIKDQPFLFMVGLYQLRKGEMIMKKRDIIRPLLTMLSVYLIVAAALGCSKPQTAIEKPLPDAAFKAAISIENPPSSLKANSVSKIAVKVTNASNTLWPAKGDSAELYRINLAYHWLDKTGKVVSEGNRTSLPYDLKPNKTVSLQTEVQAPGTPGEYILKVDLVQEAVSWFEGKGVKPATIIVNVQ